MGNRRDFSKNDVYKINKLYSCDDKLDETDIETDSGEEGGQTSTGDCTDQDWNCRIRDYLGYCDYDRETQENCRKSCNLCDSDASSRRRTTRAPTPRVNTPRPSRPDPQPSGSCADGKAKCSQWADKGYCNKYTKYMRSNCPQSCGLCERSGGSGDNREPRTTTTTPRPSQPSTQKCKDKNHHCSDWAASGRNFCSKYPNYMKKNCAKSCGVCNQRDVNPRSVQSTDDCKDRHRKCTQYEEEGYCRESHSQYSMMQMYCKKSCGLC